MLNKFRGLIWVVCLLSVCAGCASAKKSASKIDVRGYVQDKARVDQEISGRIGNWENAPMAENPERRMTRKVYYLEVTKEADPEDVEKEFETTESTTTKAITSEAYVESTKPASEQNRGIIIPKIDYDEPSQPNIGSSGTSGASGFQQYKVEKDDTLQKISKKFYNSYSKWPRIYEANKDVIKDPNAIRPGITIKIPQE
jgi:nucleoid-associated protein YgaU